MRENNVLSKIVIVIEIILAIIIIGAIIEANLPDTSGDFGFGGFKFLPLFAVIYYVLPLFVANLIYLIIPNKSIPMLIILIVVMYIIFQVVLNSYLGDELKNNYKPLYIETIKIGGEPNE